MKKRVKQFEYSFTNEMAADGLTKRLDMVTVERFVGMIDLRQVNEVN